jgi:hypothetical protein
MGSRKNLCCKRVGSVSLNEPGSERGVVDSLFVELQ